MSHQDHGLGQKFSVNHGSLREAIDWLLCSEMFSNISFRKGCCWTPLTLVATVLLWTWGSGRNVTDRFLAARKIITKAFGLQDELPSYTLMPNETRCARVRSGEPKTGNTVVCGAGSRNRSRSRSRDWKLIWPWPVARTPNWIERVNQPLSEKELIGRAELCPARPAVWS